MNVRNIPLLRDVISKAIIIAHKENTDQLVQALESEGLECEELRGPYTQEQRRYPAQIRTLINHSNAWQTIKASDGLVMVVEADFVPVKGLGNLPLPFIPQSDIKAMAWLYSVGPVIYHVDPEGQTIYGHNAGAVAYVLDRIVAKDWLSLFEVDMKSHNNELYRPWDVYLPIKLRRDKGVRCYIPFKMYGEHGGLANPEHSKSGIRSWHEADCLA